MSKISFPGGGAGGGGGHVDGRPVIDDIVPNSSGSHSVGTRSAPFDNVVAVSGQFPSGIVMTDTNGSGWLVTVSTSGTLNVGGPIVLV